MFDTSHTLIDLPGDASDSAFWQRLVDLYAPLLRGWLDRYEVQAADADDLIQDVLVVVMRELPTFRHNQQPGAFRSWLKGILINRLRNFWRARGRRDIVSGGSEIDLRLNELEDERSPLSQAGSMSTISTWRGSFWR